MTTHTSDQAPPHNAFPDQDFDPGALQEAFVRGGEDELRKVMLQQKIGAAVRAAYAEGGNEGVEKMVQQREQEAFARHGEAAFRDGAAAWFDMGSTKPSERGSASAKAQPEQPSSPRREAKADESPQAGAEQRQPDDRNAGFTFEVKPDVEEETSSQPAGHREGKGGHEKAQTEADAGAVDDVDPTDMDWRKTDTTIRREVRDATEPDWRPGPGIPGHTEVINDQDAQKSERYPHGFPVSEHGRHYPKGPKGVPPEVLDLWWADTATDSGGDWRVGKREAEVVGSRVEVLGDGVNLLNGLEVRGNKQYFKASAELFEQAGLQPRHRLEVEDRTIWFSQSFDIDGRGRAAVIGYVLTDDGSIVARSYYRSQSSGAWRYLPRYRYNEDRGGPDWYDKGYGEESLTLPSVLQEGLNRAIEADNGLLKLDKVTRESAFYGTARFINEHGTSYDQRVSDVARDIVGIPDSRYSGKPEDIELSDDKEPQFGTPLQSWQQDTSLYGPITCEVFVSADRRLGYTFCRDKKGRAWISSIEDRAAPVESTGLRTLWVKSILTTPAYEYWQQAGDNGNYEDRNGNYVDMFENYLSKIPVIQSYLKQTPQRQY